MRVMVTKRGLLFLSLLSLSMPLAASPVNKSHDKELDNIENEVTAKEKYLQTIRPEEALKRLKEGNMRFAQDKALCLERNQTRRSITASKQRPFAIVLGCSDSRVPPELAFDQGLGDVFVVRVAGNVVGATELDSVEYSAIYNQSAIIVVLGHMNCGAVSAVVEGKTTDIESIAELIQPAINKNHHVDEAIHANIMNSVNKIKQSSPIAKLIAEKKLMVVGAYYDLKTGKIHFLNEN